MTNFTTDAKICLEREVEVRDTYDEIKDIRKQFDVDDTCKWISENNFERVCLQFPDELLGVSAKVYEEIKSNVDVDLYILGDTSYASCCVDSVAAMHVQGHAVVHYGRTCLSKTDIPTHIVLPKRDLDVEEVMLALKNRFESDDDVKLCLYYDAEFEHCVDTLSNHWFKHYPHSYIARVEKEDKPNRYLGRVVFNINKEEVPIETIKHCICVYLGSRGQTVFNYTISVEASEWYYLDPASSSIERMDETTWFKRRRFLVEKCKDANTVGILVCKLSGEQTKDIICRMKQLCKVNGKKSYIVSVGKPNVAKLANFPEIDIYVMIACPENDLYSNRDFYKPIVYPFELEVALNSNRPPYFTTHVTDFDELLPGRRYYCDVSHVADSFDVSLITGKIRETKVEADDTTSTDLVEKQNWALENIGKNLQQRSWTGLEQNLGQTEVKKAEEGRKGIALQYSNEP